LISLQKVKKPTNSFKMTKIFAIIGCLVGFYCSLMAQTDESDAILVRQIYDDVLTQGSCYEWLHDLTKDIGPRFSGTEGAERAVNYTSEILKSLKIDQVRLQDVKVQAWDRGDFTEVACVNHPDGTKVYPSLALGGSVGTRKKGVKGELVEVFSLDTLELLGEAGLKDKIVFFNRPMDPTQIRTFNAYGGAVDQRVYGATRAAKYGAKAAIIRSMTTLHDDAPHTGTMYYEPTTPKKIPGIAISTNAAEELSSLLDSQRKVEICVKNSSSQLDSVMSHNVIGEIVGSEFPDEIILIGGHLDSWDVGEGAHDDGSGCVHALQVIETLKRINYKPKHTIRCVMFMNEENGLAGGRKYAAESDAAGEFHMAAIESDSGGFTPRGFSCDADTSVFKKYFRDLNGFLPILENYDLFLKKGGSGADISPLKSQKGLLIGLRPDSQRYFDYHHTELDVFEVVNERELKLGAAAMTSLVYLIDKYGIGK